MSPDAQPHDPFVPFEDTAIDGSIAARFEQQVARHPDRIAVGSAHGDLTYAELDRVANRVARAILSRRGRGEEPVALLLDHGSFLIAALLGILKAGKFYVALDLPDPQPRMASVLDDSQAKLLVTNTTHLARAGELARGRDLEVLDCDALDASHEAGSLDRSIAPEAPALMLYTSGTTGRPKGVVHSHRNILVEARNYTNYARISSEDRLTLWHSCSYTNSVRNLYAALLNGAGLFVYDLLNEGFPGLADWMLARRITVIHTLPTTFRSFCQTLKPDAMFPDLRILRLGGEPINRDDIKQYQRRFSPRCLLIHAIGPTETLDIRYYTIHHDWSGGDAKIPIGYALPDKDVLLLDEAGREVGPEEIGEIAVRSKFLALGYWGQPELTRAAFTADADDGDERLYRTGDLGVMRADGCLTHLGRKDLQIKIRGYRVEVNVVEDALLAMDSIEAAAVQGRAADGGEPRLVAYVVPAAGKAPKVNELRQALSRTLPEYMMPSAFVFLEKLPLSTTGKLDRRALPAPTRARPNLAQVYVAPQDPLEEILAGIWATLLDLDTVGVHDNFLDLGGHSLLAAHIISRVRDEFGVDLAPRQFFEARTVAGLVECIGAARRSGRGPQAIPIARAPQLPLSFAQERLWFIEQLEPGTPVHNIPAAFRLSGPLNVALLERSLNDVVRRHEVLRSSFGAVGGQPVQVLAPAATVRLAVVDLRGEPDPPRRVEALITREIQRPFQLSQGPLLRAVLLRPGDSEYVLVLVTHHLVFDGLSTNILLRELSALYEAHAAGRAPQLATLPIQYADYARWQREWLRDDVLEEQMAYWRRKLAGLERLQLPTDRPRPRAQTVRTARHFVALSQGLTGDLKRLSVRHGVTLFMTLLAAYQALLHRHTGQSDIAIGSPSAGRDRRELEDLIGFFFNMLVLRTDLSGHPTFAELLLRAREVCLEAYAHQDVPFEKLVEGLRPERDLSYNPFFQVTFALQHAAGGRFKLADVTATELPLDPRTARYELHLYLREEDGGLWGYIDYNTDLFDAPTIARLTEHFQLLLERVVVKPDEPIGGWPLLTEPERHRLLDEWNGTAVAYPRERCIHQLYEAQAERTPDAVAVVFGDQRLTYRELNRRANRLAHHLRRLGVGPEVPVAFRMERSLEMVIGLLAILKAGGAYVPLDPDLPQDRLAFMLADVRARVLLTQPRLTPAPPALDSRLGVVCLDEGRDGMAQESEENPASGATADNLAYIMYTSGSTGRPKGVCVPHRAVVRLVSGATCASLAAREVFLQLAPLSFDASTFEIWGSLLNGAQLVVYPPDRPSLRELGRILERHQVTTLWLTAGLFHAMVEGDLTGLAPVRQLLTGGDVVSAPHARKALRAHPHCRLVNCYGPTEGTTFTTCFALGPSAALAASSSVPIGRPIANTSVYVLDDHLNPVPLGISGELHIGGDGLARHYLGDPALTAERFIPNPFSDEPGARLYRTGDLARYLPDGNIEFIGRSDHQVKIRGYRIEPGEIEAVLSQHSAIREAVVVAREDGGGDKRLVAYVVPSQEAHPTGTALRGFLKSRLPEHMVPSTFVRLHALPLTPNGKVDRGALPGDTGARSHLEKAFVAPRNAAERAIAETWAQLLGLDQVGVHDNFFELGGHSLLAARLVARLGDTLRVEIPLCRLFEAPTVSELAQAIEHTNGHAASASEEASATIETKPEPR